MARVGFRSRAPRTPVGEIKESTRFSVAKGQSDLDRLEQEVLQSKRGYSPMLKDSSLRSKLSQIVDLNLKAIGDKYTLRELLGEGRFSQVFHASAVSGGGEWALKEVAQKAFDEMPDETMVRDAAAPASRPVALRCSHRLPPLA